jgi:hypothetical protein
MTTFTCGSLRDVREARPVPPERRRHVHVAEYNLPGRPEFSFDTRC